MVIDSFAFACMLLLILGLVRVVRNLCEDDCE